MTNPFDPAPERTAMSRDERVFLIMFFAIVLGLFAVEVFSDYEPGKLGMLLFPFCWAILLVIHEAGHAIAAKMCGWSVEGIVIGMGKPVGTFSMGGVPIELRVIPLEGFTALQPSPRAGRLAGAFTYFAGPATGILVGIVIIAVIGWDTFLSRNQSYGLVVAQTFAAAAWVGAILNLIPAGIRTPGGLIPNDGLGILRCLLARRQDL